MQLGYKYGVFPIVFFPRFYSFIFEDTNYLIKGMFQENQNPDC